MQIAQVSKAQNRICLLTEMNGWPYRVVQANWHLAFQKGRLPRVLRHLGEGFFINEGECHG